MFTYTVLLSTLIYTTADAVVSMQDMKYIKNELTGLENYLKCTYKKTLEDVDKNVTIKLEEVKESGENKIVECVTVLGKILIAEAEEKAREGCMGFIESCRNFLEMLDRGDMNQIELIQTKNMLDDGGLFRKQINHTVNVITSYVKKKIEEFDNKVKECY